MNQTISKIWLFHKKLIRSENSNESSFFRCCLVQSIPCVSLSYQPIQYDNMQHRYSHTISTKLGRSELCAVALYVRCSGIHTICIFYHANFFFSVAHMVIYGGANACAPVPQKTRLCMWVKRKLRLVWRGTMINRCRDEFESTSSKWLVLTMRAYSQQYQLTAKGNNLSPSISRLLWIVSWWVVIALCAGTAFHSVGWW